MSSSNKDTFINDVPLIFSMTTSAYFLQSLSDAVWVDSVPTATKLAQIASIRHYRASTMMCSQIYIKSTVSIPTIDFLSTEIEDSDICNSFLKNDNILYDSILKTIPNDRNNSLFETRKSYADMILYTRKYVSMLPHVKIKKIEFDDDDKFYNTYICIQCGQIFNDIEDISECTFCGAGINHITYIYDIL